MAETAWVLRRVSRARSALGRAPRSRIAWSTTRSLYWRMPTWLEPTGRRGELRRGLREFMVVWRAPLRPARPRAARGSRILSTSNGCS